jgi:hypothetical protein
MFRFAVPAAIVITFHSACTASEAIVKRIDEKKGTVWLADALSKQVAILLIDRLIILPKPGWGPPDFEVGERVEFSRQKELVVIRRPARIASAERGEFDRLPQKDRDAIERWRESKRRAEPSVLELQRVREGDIGRLPLRLRVLQVTGDNSVRLAYDNGKYDVYLEGVSTKEMADDRIITVPGLFRMVGMKRYETASGGSRQVPLLKPWSEPAAPATAAEDEAAARAFDKHLAERWTGEIEAQVKAIEKEDAKKGAAKKEAAKKKAATKTDASANEATAMLRLRLAKRLTSERSRPEKIERLEAIVKDFTGTKAAKEAAEMLEEMKKQKK